MLAAMLLSAVPAAAAFRDTAGHWAEKTLDEWQDEGLIDGYGDGSFQPNGTVTRAEFIKLVNRTLGFTAESEISFSDVTERDWFHAEVARAVAAAERDMDRLPWGASVTVVLAGDEARVAADHVSGGAELRAALEGVSCGWGAGDVAGAVEQTWTTAKEQIKRVVNNVIFPVVDMILAVLFFVKLGTAYFDYRKHGQFEFTAPCILFACLVFTLTAPLYIWKILG